MSSAESCEILLVDDDPIVRRAIRELIEQSSDLHVVEEVGSARRAFDTIVSAQPDLVILDLSMSGSVTGFDLTTRVKQSIPDVLVLVVSVHKEGFYVERAREAGADGYVSKDHAEDQLTTAISALREGRTFFSPPT